MKKKPIKLRFIHDVDSNCKIAGRWHAAWRMPDSDRIAFHAFGKWFASVPVLGLIECRSKAEAIG